MCLYILLSLIKLKSDIPINSGHCTMGKCTSGVQPNFWAFQQLFYYFKITKMLISQSNLNGFVFCKKHLNASVLPQFFSTHLTSSFNFRMVQIWPRTFPLPLCIVHHKIDNKFYSVILVEGLSAEVNLMSAINFCISLQQLNFIVQRRDFLIISFWIQNNREGTTQI